MIHIRYYNIKINKINTYKIYWYSKISIHITGESTEIKRHQTPTKNKSTEMLCMVNAIVRIGNMDTHQ